MDCPECKSKHQKNIFGEMVCSSCGLVIESIIVNEQSNKIKDSYFVGGQPIKPKRLGLHFIYSRNERQYYFGIQDIEILANFLKLPKIAETEAIHIWKSSIDQKLCEGRSYETIISACVYLAIVVHQTVIGKSTIEYFEVNKQVIRASEIINSKLDLRIVLPQSTEFHIIRNAEKLGYEKKLISDALAILRKNNLLFTGRTKESVSLGILYYLSVKYCLKQNLIDFCRCEDISPKSVKDVSKLLEAQNDSQD